MACQANNLVTWRYSVGFPVDRLVFVFNLSPIFVHQTLSLIIGHSQSLNVMNVIDEHCDFVNLLIWVNFDAVYLPLACF